MIPSNAVCECGHPYSAHMAHPGEFWCLGGGCDCTEFREKKVAAPLAVRPHPIDVALASISEALAELLASGKPSRFVEINGLTRLASKLQRFRPAAGVADIGVLDGEEFDGDGEVGVVGYNANPRRLRPFNDAVDLNREIIMVAQNFLKSYLETEKLKANKPQLDVRLDTVLELSHLMGLRTQLAKDGTEPVPEEINRRIDDLLQRTGEPAHEPQSDTVVHPEPLRRHPPDGAGQPDGDRVGEPLAD